MDLTTHSLLRDTMRSLGFLSRIHISAVWFVAYDGQLSKTCRAFPIAAAIMTLPAVCVLLFSYLLALPPLLAATLTVLALVMISGALHEDGIADVADGFFGGNTKEQRLEIMKDSRIGTYGAVALIVSFSVRTIAIAAIFQESLISAILAVMAACVISRGALVWHWSDLESARPGGTSDRAGAPTEDAALFAIVTAIALALVCALLSRGITAAVISSILMLATTFAFRKLTFKMIGGQTGDTLGASAVLAEITFLIGLASGL